MSAAYFLGPEFPGLLGSLVGLAIARADGVAAVAGSACPIFAPVTGGLGAAVAGSNTVSNMMFSLFQFEMGQRMAVDPMGIAALQAVGGLQAGGNGHPHDALPVRLLRAAAHRGDGGAIAAGPRAPLPRRRSRCRADGPEDPPARGRRRERAHA